MKYGTIVREKSHMNGVIEITEEKVIKSATVAQHVTYQESIRIGSEADVLAQFLKLQDDHKAGKITDYGLRCYTDGNGQIVRIEKLWKV